MPITSSALITCPSTATTASSSTTTTAAAYNTTTSSPPGGTTCGKSFITSNNNNNKSTDDLFQFDIESSSYRHHRHHHHSHHSHSSHSHDLLGRSQESKESIDSVPLTTQPLQQQQQQQKQQQQSQCTSSKSSITNRSRKVQPLVYSAIGSLEKINHDNLGSFQGKVHLARQRIRIDKQQKHHTSNSTNNNNSREIEKLQQSHRTRSTSGGETKGNDDVLATNNLPFSSPDPSSDTVTVKTTPSSSQYEGDDLDGLSTPCHQKNKTHHKSKSDTHLNTTTKTTTATPDNNKTRNKNSTNSNNSNNTDTTKAKRRKEKKKKVTIDSKRQIRHVELFRPSCDAYTPRIMQRKEIKYKPAEQRQRASMETMSTTMGTISRPNYRDALRRVAMILQQHIVKIEQRFESGVANNLNLFTRDMRDEFAEENFVTPRYKYSMVNIPMGRGGVVYGMRKIRNEYRIPSADDIYEFGHQLFNQVQLSSECSIICLIYVERLMEVAKVPVMATTWRPIFMCGLLLASKVWQDWASWNIEFASVYPQFSLDAINKLEVKFCKMVKWDLYISSSLYAKYYFALRSLLEKQDFRRRYVQMVGGVDNVAASEAVKVSKRSEMMKEKALSHLSLSM